MQKDRGVDLSSGFECISNPRLTEVVMKDFCYFPRPTPSSSRKCATQRAIPFHPFSITDFASDARYGSRHENLATRSLTLQRRFYATICDDCRFENRHLIKRCLPFLPPNPPCGLSPLISSLWQRILVSDFENEEFRSSCSHLVLYNGTTTAA